MIGTRVPIIVMNKINIVFSTTKSISAIIHFQVSTVWISTRTMWVGILIVLYNVYNIMYLI